ncbi:MAG: hypothetical protein LBU70_04975 [Chitinispirillales bacterium]|jgi:hypothetical protein|nr:hypothetical protein [Chitinispirillales bacterium]
MIRGGTGRNTEPQLMTHLSCSNTRRGILQSFSNTDSGNLPGVTGTLGVQHGGTGRGITTQTGALYRTSSLQSAGFDIGTLPIAQGGTGQTTAALARNALGLGNTTGALPIANGGTNAITAANARTQLGITPTNIGALATSGGTLSGSLHIDIGDHRLTIDARSITFSPRVLNSSSLSFRLYYFGDAVAIQRRIGLSTATWQFANTTSGGNVWN